MCYENWPRLVLHWHQHVIPILTKRSRTSCFSKIVWDAICGASYLFIFWQNLHNVSCLRKYASNTQSIWMELRAHMPPNTMIRLPRAAVSIALRSMLFALRSMLLPHYVRSKTFPFRVEKNFHFSSTRSSASLCRETIQHLPYVQQFRSNHLLGMLAPFRRLCTLTGSQTAAIDSVFCRNCMFSLIGVRRFRRRLQHDMFGLYRPIIEIP